MNLTNLKLLAPRTYGVMQAPGYPLPVLIYVPKNCGPDPKRFVLYMHGWRGICDHVSDDALTLFKNFSLGDSLDKFAPPDTIFVMPISRGHCDDFKNALIPRFEEFNVWMRTIFNTDIDCILAGHSGAYLPMVQLMIKCPHFTVFVRGVILLDALYGNVEAYETIMNQNKTMKLRSVYLKRGGTDQTSKDLVQAVGARAQALPAQTTEHCQVPRVHFGPMLQEICK